MTFYNPLLTCWLSVLYSLCPMCSSVKKRMIIAHSTYNSTMDTIIDIIIGQGDSVERERERLQFQPHYANYLSRVPPSPLFGFLLEILPLRHNDYLQEHSFTLSAPNNNYILIQCNNCYIQHSNRKVHSCGSFLPAQHPQYLFLM